MTDVLPGKLVIIRHAESAWNALGKWTGRTDVSLTPKGFAEAAQFGEAFARTGIVADVAFCSEQVRTRETLDGILAAAGQPHVEVRASAAINERDYGEYTGKNKWEMKELLGEAAFNDVRRGWDVPVPGGETLRMVYERAVPFYRETVLPLLAAGKHVLIVSHGNTIRALKKYMESISDEAIAEVEMPFGQILICEVSGEGHVVRSSSLAIDTTPPQA